VLCCASGLVHLPELYSSFVEEQYKFVFAIAIQYTNPFRYVTRGILLCFIFIRHRMFGLSVENIQDCCCCMLTIFFLVMSCLRLVKGFIGKYAEDLDEPVAVCNFSDL